MYTVASLLQEMIATARKDFLATVENIPEKVLHLHPGGKALSLAAAYAHLVFSEDVIIHQLIQGKKPLFETIMKGKTGASQVMPPMDEQWEKAHEAWAKVVKLDLPAFKKYSETVFAATDAYVARLKEKDFSNIIDLGGWGKFSVARLLHSFVAGHTSSLMGEISAIKGIHGLKGYPF